MPGVKQNNRIFEGSHCLLCERKEIMYFCDDKNWNYDKVFDFKTNYSLQFLGCVDCPNCDDQMDMERKIYNYYNYYDNYHNIDIRNNNDD